MKSTIVTLLALLSLNINATDILCSIKVNTQNEFETKLSMDVSQKVKFASADNFTFFLNRINESDYELELLDTSVPSRSYAKATLNTQTDKLQYSLWNRDILLETSCRIVK
jgi:hypothetical protein